MNSVEKREGKRALLICIVGQETGTFVSGYDYVKACSAGCLRILEH